MAYKQAKQRHKKLIKTYKETKNSCGSGVGYNKDRNFYYKFVSSNTPGYSKYLKRLSNKKIRQAKNSVGSFGAYRKLYDYKWQLF